MMRNSNVKSMNKYIWLLFMCFLIVGCHKQDKRTEEETTEDYICTCPPTIYLQPYSDFSQKEAKALIPHLKRFLSDCSLSEIGIEVRPNINLEQSFLNDSQTRYRADKMLKAIPMEKFNAVIQLTHQDISMTYKGRADWGVLGLSFQGKHICVVSDFRLKNKKRDFWKVVCHELSHSFFNLPHCPNDDPHCIVKDAKGHPDFSNKEHLCKSCTEKIQL